MLNRRRSMFLFFATATSAVGSLAAYKFLFDEKPLSEKTTPLARHLQSMLGSEQTSFGRRLSEADSRSLLALSESLGNDFKDLPSKDDLFDQAESDIVSGRFRNFGGWSFTKTEWEVIAVLHRI